MKNNLKQTSLTIALVLALSMSVVPVAQTAPVTTSGGVILDALVDDGAGYQSIISERPIWSNGAATTVAVDVTGGPDEINEVLFGLTAFDDPAVPEFLDLTIVSGPVGQAGAPALSGWADSVDDDDADGDSETARWSVTPPEDTCALPVPTGENCENTLITEGNTYRFEVELAPEDVVDRSLQHWSITVSIFDATQDNDLILVGFDDTLPTISTPTVSWSGGLAAVTFDVTDPASTETDPSPRPSGISTITATTNPEGTFNAECDSSSGSLVSLDPSVVEDFGYGPGSLSCTLSGLDPAVSNTVTLVATDAAGNAFALPDFDLDTTIPDIQSAFDDGSGDAPSDSDISLWHSELGATGLTFTAEDTTSGLATVSLTADGDAVTCPAIADALALYTCTVALDDIPVGAVEYVFTAVDVAGNEDSESVPLKIDRTAPVSSAVEAVDATDAAIEANGAGWFNVVPDVFEISAADCGALGDDCAGVAQLTYDCGSGLTSLAGAGPFDVSVPNAGADGEYTLSYFATDASHAPVAEAPQAFEFNLDTEAPTSTLAGPLGFQAPDNVADPAAGSTFGLTCNADDGTGSGVKEVLLYHAHDDGVADLADPASYSTSGMPITCDGSPVDFTALLSGDHYFFTLATDVADNEEALPTLPGDATVVQVDLTVPEAAVDLGAGQMAAANTPVVALDVSFGDDHSGIASTSLEYFAGTEWQEAIADPAGGTHSVDLDALAGGSAADGSYAFRLVATDNVGLQTTSDEVAFELDRTLATFTLDNLQDGDFLGPSDLSGGEFTLAGTIEEGGAVDVDIDAGGPDSANVDDGAAAAGISPWSYAFAPLADTAQSLTAEGEDSLGNAGPPIAAGFQLDTLPPTVSSSVPSDLNVAGLGTVVFTVSDAGSGPVLDAGDVSAPAGAVVSVVDDTYEVDLSAIDTADTYSVSITPVDEVGNSGSFSWTVDLDPAFSTPVITSGHDGVLALNEPTPGPQTIEGTLESGWSLVSWDRSAGTPSGGATCGTADTGAGFTDNGDGTWTVPVDGFTRSGGFGCVYTLTVTAADPFDTQVSDTLQVDNLDIKEIDVALAATDSFLQTGGVTNVIMTATNADGGALEANVRINLYHTEVDEANLIATRTTDTTGKASVPIGTQALFSASDSHQLIAVATEQLIPLVGFEPVVPGAQGSEDVVFTRIVPGAAGLTSDADAYIRGTAATLSLPLVWEHDDSIATGLTTSCAGDASANAPCYDGGHNFHIALGGVMEGQFAEGAEPGTYEANHASPTAVTKSFTAKGSSLGYRESGTDPPTSFAIPEALQPTLDVHWVSAVADLTLTNGVDTTPDFVNLDDVVRFDVAVTSETGQTIVDPVVTLFEFGAPSTSLDVCQDGAACDLNPDAGVVGFDVEYDSFGALTFPGTETIHAMVTAFEVNGETFTADIDDGVDVGDFSDSAAITFTGVTVAIDGTYDLVASGGADNFASDRIWKTADGFDPVAGSGTENGDDEVTIRVTATWDHNGSDTANAAIRIKDGADAFVADSSGNAIEAAFVAGNVYEFVLDPDAIAGASDATLDYLINDFEFVLDHALEPGLTEATDPSITYQDAASVESIEAVWTVVDLAFTDGSGDPLDDVELVVGAETPAVVAATFRLPGSPSATDLAFSSFELGLIDEVVADVEDTTPLTWATQTFLLPEDTSAGHVLFNLARGCTAYDLVSVAPKASVCAGGTADADEAAWHRFTPQATGTPHNIGLGETPSVDILWTAIALDTTSDRLTAPVDQDITYTVTAHFAHAFDQDGVALEPIDSAYPDDVVVGFDGEQDTVPSGGSAAFTHSLSTPGTEALKAICFDAGSGCQVFKPGTTDPVDYTAIVADGPTLTRQWLDLEVVPAFNDGQGGDAGALLAMGDRLVLRGDTPTVAFTANILDGSAPAEVDDTYAGYAFATTDTAGSRQLAERVHAADLFALTGQTPFTVSFSSGGEEIATSSAASYNVDRWEVVVPEGVTTALDTGIDIAVNASLQVTDEDETTVVAEYADDDQLVVTSIDLAIVENDAASVDDAGTYWVNLADDLVVGVNATWSHDASDVTGLVLENAYAPGDNVAGTIDATAAGAGASDYDVTLGNPATSEVLGYVLRATDGIATLDDGATPKTFTADGGVLTGTDADATAIFTQAVISFPVADDQILNTNDGAEVGFTVKWEHSDESLDFFTVEFGIDPVASGAPDSIIGFADDGTGFVFLSSDLPQSATLDETNLGDVTLERGISQYIVGNEGQTLTWTQMVTTIGSISGATGGTGTEADPYTFDLGTAVDVPVSATLAGIDEDAMGGDDPALGALFLVAGTPFQDGIDTDPENGEVTATFQSSFAQKIPIDAQAVLAEVDGDDIFSSSPADVVWLEWV